MVWEEGGTELGSHSTSTSTAANRLSGELRSSMRAETNASNNITAVSNSGSETNPPHSPTPILHRRLAKSFSVAPTGTQAKG